MPKSSLKRSKSSSEAIEPQNLMAGGGFLCLCCLLWLLIVIVVSQRIQMYQVGSCTILTKQLVQKSRTLPSTGDGDYSDPIPIYVPTFQFWVQTADGHHYRAQGYTYDPLGTLEDSGAWDDKNIGQAIIDAYPVGQTYPCWYDPSDPTQAVLTRQIRPTVFAEPIFWSCIGGIIFLCGLLWQGWRVYRRRKEATVSQELRHL